MSQDLCKSLKLYSDVLNMYRFYPKIDRVEMTKRLNISGTTFYKAIDDLQSKGLLTQAATVSTGRGKPESSYILASELFYMLGISIGASLCKIVFIGTNFQRMPAEKFSIHKTMLVERIKEILIKNNAKTDELDECIMDTDRNYIFFATPKDSFRCLKQVINTVFDYCRELIENGNLNLFSIGISSTGMIDRDAQIIVRSHNLPYLEGIKIDGLIDPTNRDYFIEKKIQVSLVQNSDASVIAEIIDLYTSNSPFKGKTNIVTLYLGYGIGSGLYLDGKLFSGCHGFAGETGQLTAPIFIEECAHPLSKNIEPSDDPMTWHVRNVPPGNDILSTWNHDKNCPYFSQDIMSYDEKIRKYVFELDEEDKFKDWSSKSIYKFLNKNRKNTLLLGKYLGGMVNTITNLLNVELIIFTGKIYRSFDLIADDISQEQGNRGVKLGRTGRDDCALVKSKLGSLSPTIGAAIYSYHKKCDIPLSWNYPEQ